MRSADAKLSLTKNPMTKMEDPAAQNVANHYAVFHIIKTLREDPKMDNANAWKIDKTFKGTGVHIDIKNKTIRMNPKNSWVRFETQDLIHVYTFEPKEKTS